MSTNSDDNMCKLTCRSFYCSKKMLRIQKSGDKKQFICGMDQSECLGFMCNYAECRERKLSDSGECLRPRKPAQPQQQAKKKPINPYDDYNYITPNDLDDKFRKKLTKKLK